MKKWKFFLLLLLPLTFIGYQNFSVPTNSCGNNGRIESNLDIYTSPLVFDWKFYTELNQDLRNAGINNEKAAQGHWLNFGICEGRRAHASFFSIEYLGLFQDLQSAFGVKSYDKAVMHYVQFGNKEGRQATNTNSTYGIQLDGGNSVIGNEVLMIKTWGKYASAVSEIWLRGKQIVNNRDTGRLVQTAFQLDGLGECYNPTEGGSHEDYNAASTSRLNDISVNTKGFLTAGSGMAYWFAPKKSWYCGVGQGIAPLSDYVMRKNIQVGYQGDPLVVSWEVQVNMPRAHSLLNIEALTGYFTSDMTSSYQFNPITRQAEPYNMTQFDGNAQTTDWSGFSSQFPRIIATPDGSYAVGAITFDIEKSGGFRETQVSTYGGFYFHVGNFDDKTAKWSNIYAIKNTEKKVYSFKTLVFFGNINEVKAKMDRFYNNQTDQVLAMFSKNKGLNIGYYAQKNPDVVAAFGGTSTKLTEHFLKFGMKEGRSGSADFNAVAYINRYADLKAVFGNDYLGAMKHYYTSGVKEGRRATP